MLNMDALDMPPNGSDSFLWADFAELRALVHPDRQFCQADLEGIAYLRKGMYEEDNGFNDSNTEIYVRSKRGFNVEQRWQEIANFVGRRQVDFGESYPFCLSDDKDTIEVKQETFERQHFVYLGLLVASSLRLIKDNRRNEITRIFERFSYAVFSQLMPSGSVIKPTWAQGGVEVIYQGQLYQKMLEIANDIRCEKPNIEQADYKSRNRGDGGIDIIAWHPMADSRAGIPIAFAQCGCSVEDWRFKQSDCSWERHHWRLPVIHPWANYYFMPLDLRRPEDGDWAYKNEIRTVIIVDRLRLLRLISQYKLDEQLPAMPFIDEIIALRYS